MFSFQVLILFWTILGSIIPFSSTLEGIQVIVINSTYTNSTVKTTNNFDSILHGLENYEREKLLPSKTTFVSSKEQNVAGDPQKTLIQPNSFPILQQYSNYFGTAFSPYVKNDMVRVNGYTTEDIDRMLKIILTKCHSVLTFEMGYYANPFFYGPYDATSTAKIASTAAQINLQRNASVLTISQGAYILDNSFATQRFPDLDAAFHSAKKANGIYPGTVSGITIFVQDASSSGFVGLTPTTAYYATLLLRQYSPQAHSQNIKMGVVVGFCNQILDPNDGNWGKRLLLGMITVADYVICEIYPTPTVSISGATEYTFDGVKNSFQLIKDAFSKVAPSLEIILFTGFQSNQYSFGNFFQFYQNNNYLMIKRFWDAVEQWSIESRQKAYMNQAFDTFEKAEVGYGNKELLNGCWKRLENGMYLVKGTQETVSV